MTSTIDPILAACFIDPRYLLVTRQVSVAVASSPRITTETPVLKLEDMQQDIDRLIAKEAIAYTDPSCVFLHTDELESEGRVVIVNVLQKHWLIRARSRVEFFKIVKSAVRNRFRSLVQQHRFTQKRTGVKPPPKHKRDLSPWSERFTESRKRPEVSLDDPEVHLQVSDIDDQTVHVASHIDTKECVARIRAACNWFERAVLDQMLEPDSGVLTLATLDAMRGKRADRVQVKIEERHIVEAVSEYVPLSLYQKAVLKIKQITNRIQHPMIEEERHNHAVKRLSEIFTVQVPPNLKPTVLRRLFTICARDNWQRVDSEVEDLLAVVGATAPKFNSGSMQCLGVLYQEGHRTCESCGVKVSCAVQSANVGVSEITLSPKLLGAKLSRVPILLPNARRIDPPPTSSLRDMEILGYLTNRNKFRQVTRSGETYFQSTAFRYREKLLFSIGTRSIPLRLRFCSPSKELRAKLICVNKLYYAPEKASASEVIALVDEHAKHAYV